MWYHKIYVFKMDSGCWVAQGEAGRAVWEAAGMTEASDAGGLTRVALGGEWRD